jgi:small GTP-binding protein
MQDCNYNLLVKCAIIGDTGVGKTSIVTQYISQHFSRDFTPTIGIEFQTNTHKANNGSIVKFQIWDTGGDLRYRQVLNSFIKDSLILILVYDRNDRDTFDRMEYWIKMSYESQLKKGGIPLLMIVANKSDTKGVVSDKEGEHFALVHGAKFAKVSAISKQSVNNLFTIITEELVKINNTTPSESSISEEEDKNSLHLYQQPQQDVKATEKIETMCCRQCRLM